MRRAFSIAIAFSLVILVAGCKKDAASAENQIRIAIDAHLAHKGTLNLQAFDTVVKQVTIQGDHARAQVEFHVKNGPGMMQLTYALERSGGNWAVVESNPVGADFSHPSLDSSQSPAAGGPAQPNAVLSEAVRNFKAGTLSSSPSLPPGHPPVVASPPTSPR